MSLRRLVLSVLPATKREAARILGADPKHVEIALDRLRMQGKARRTETVYTGTRGPRPAIWDRA